MAGKIDTKIIVVRPAATVLAELAEAIANAKTE
jgi:hypothetical protein